MRTLSRVRKNNLELANDGVSEEYGQAIIQQLFCCKNYFYAYFPYSIWVNIQSRTVLTVSRRSTNTLIVCRASVSTRRSGVQISA